MAVHSKTSDPYAEETLLGLLLTGDAEVYRFSVDLEPRDFENPSFAGIARALTVFWDFLADSGYESDIAVSDIVARLEGADLIYPSGNGLPLSWYADVMEKAVSRTNAAIDKLANHSVPLTLRESVSILVCKVKLAAANREDSLTGAAVFEEIFALDFDRLTPTEIVESLMQAGGAGAEYLGRFKESSRSWVVSCLLGKAGERMLVEV